MEENVLVQPEAPVVDVAPDDVPGEGVVVEESVISEESELNPVEVAESEEEIEEKPEVIDTEPEIKPDSQLAEALGKLAKLENKLGYEQRQRERLEKQISRQQLQPQETDTAAPKPDDFETYEDYQEAKIKFEVQKEIQQYQQRVKASEIEGSLEGFITETTTAGRERYSDFDEVVLQNHVPITKPMLELMQNCENPESIAYYLGKNIKEATAISRMSPIQAARTLGLIEARVGAEMNQPPAPTRKISNAPPPVRPTGPGNIITKDPNKMSQSEYEAWRAKGGGR